jgi:NhaA family Na+:H+ antiporter
VTTLRAFLKLESAGGIVLMAAAGLALVVANSPLSAAYSDLLTTRVAVIFGGLQIDKPLVLWINDGLMAIFFLLISLEVKREVLEGELSDRDQIILPGVGALGGFLVPAGIYVAVNWGDSAALNGWAIPAATDIAFALGVLALLGPRVPLTWKVFLTSLAIVDDLAAILVIAVFYTSNLSPLALSLAGLGVVALALMNRFGVLSIAAYILVGVAVWIFVLKSGVHATLAGVAVGMAIPLRGSDDTPSPLHRLEHSLHPWAAYGILPLFAFANAGVPLGNLAGGNLVNPVSVGIVLALFVGKQVGVFGAVWLSIRAGLVRMPRELDWASLYGLAVLTGIGFTMSLFIGSLAFEAGGFEYFDATRLGVLVGSSVSALLGYGVLKLALPER